MTEDNEMHWLNIIEDNEELTNQFCEFFMREVEEARKELAISGEIVTQLRTISEVLYIRSAQLQEIKSVLDALKIRIKDEKIIQYDKYRNKNLSLHEVEKYAELDDKVLDLERKINRVRLVRNKMECIYKALQCKDKHLSEIVRCDKIVIE